MKYANLHLDDKNVWGHPLDRVLLKALIKNKEASVEYITQDKSWKLNGRKVNLAKGNQYSRIQAIVLGVFHQLKYVFNPSYRRAFNSAKAKISLAFRNASESADRLEKQVKNRTDALPRIATVIETSKEAAKNLLEQSKTKSSRRLSQIDELQKGLALEKEEHGRLLGLLEDLQSAIPPKRQEIISELKKVEEFKLVPFENLTSSALDEMIAYQSSCIEELEAKWKSSTETLSAMKAKSQNVSLRYEQKIDQLARKQETIEHSPIKKELSRRSLLPETPLVSDLDEKNPDLEVPPLDFDSVKTEEAALSAASKVWLKKIEECVDEASCQLWTMLLKRFCVKYGEDRLQSFKEETPFQYLLKFSEPLKIWLPSTNEKGEPDPVGGIIMLIGSNQYHNKKETTLRISFKDGMMRFHGGMEIYVMTPEWAKKLTFGRMSGLKIVDVVEYKPHKDGKKYSLMAKWWGFSKDRVKTMPELKNAWGNTGEILLDDQNLDSYLQNKVDEAKT